MRPQGRAGAKQRYGEPDNGKSEHGAPPAHDTPFAAFGHGNR
jgi:hypothetical protein